MDETPLYLNMPPSTTVQKLDQREKTLEHKTRKLWSTAILAILASAEKFWYHYLFLKLKRKTYKYNYKK